MEERFYELLIVLRHRRKEIMQQLIEKNIYISNGNLFEFSDYIKVFYDKKIIFTKMEVRVNTWDTLIYYNNEIDSKNESHYSRSYFSIIDIYEGLNNTSDRTKKKLLEVLNEGLVIESKVEYRNDFYKFKALRQVFTTRNKIFIDERKLEMNQLLLTLSLIQFKSNALFYRSKTPEYMNGIINLLYVLLSQKKDNPILLGKQWKYDAKNKKYLLERDRISAIFLIISDVLSQTYIDFVVQMNQCDSMECIRQNFLFFYNLNTSSTVTNFDLLTRVVIDRFADQVNSDYRIKKFLLNKVKKGLYEITGESLDDYKDSYMYEYKSIQGENYIYLVLSTYREYEYYLTNSEKESIIESRI